MISELGHFSLILALVVAAIQGVVPLLGAWQQRLPLMALARPAACAQLCCIVFAYACLSWAFISSDFSVYLAAANSHTSTPLIYKITGVWGNHEGSMLLWAMSLSLWTVAVSVFSRNLPVPFMARVLGVMGCVSTSFLAFSLFTSNPFQRLLPAVAEGQDLNPMLQDPGMVIHPPLLYMGYVGFSVAFAFAIAALLSGRMDAAWARWSRPWTTIAWVLLTIGIVIGSGWAYYELGWGGWWFWDPVENASFIPWLLGTALVHSLAVTEKRGAFRSWTILLAIGTFSLSLLGTFIVRSGVITSVHAFATDPARGLFILCLLIGVIGISLLLFAWRAPSLQKGGHFGLVSRDSALLGNNVLLAVVTASVLLGTLYPLLLDALGLGKISVGPPYFETIFVPLMTPVVILMIVGSFTRWKQDNGRRILRLLAPAALLSVVLSLGMAALLNHLSWRTVLGFLLANWVLIGSAQLLFRRLRGQQGNWQQASIPAAWWGMWFAHLGIAFFIIGVTMVKSFESSIDVKMLPGQSAQLQNYSFTLKNVAEVQGPNWQAHRASIEVSRNARLIKTLQPEKRYYVAHAMPMTQAALDVGLWRDLYASLGEPLEDGGWIVSLYHKPFISWIWFGCLLMVVGGVVSICDRRYRTLASRRSAETAPLASSSVHVVNQ